MSGTTVKNDAKSLLVGVGDADETNAALSFAATEAKRHGLGVRLVHVQSRPSPLLTDTVLIQFEGAHLVAQDLVAAAAERLAHLTGGDVEIECLVRRGRVSRVLTELAQDAEMVVLQHRELSALARVVSGSVVVDVAGRATVPVVSVPQRWRRAEEPAAVVCVALDGRRGQEALLGRAFATAASSGAALTIVHAWFLGTAYDDVVMNHASVDTWAELAHRRILERTEALRSRYPDVDVRIEVRHQPPADAIVATARHTDLVLLGRRHRRHDEHLGAIARSVLSASSVPVMVVPTTALPEAPTAGSEDSSAGLRA